jgi:hypothetical protein
VFQNRFVFQRIILRLFRPYLKQVGIACTKKIAAKRYFLVFAKATFLLNNLAENALKNADVFFTSHKYKKEQQRHFWSSWKLPLLDHP